MVLDFALVLAGLLKHATEWMLTFVHRDLVCVLSKKKLALLRELNFVVRCPDYSAVLDLVWGLPMAGWARHCPNLVQRMSKPPEPLDASLDGVAEHNMKVLASVRSTGSKEAGELAWSKCQKEFDTKGLMGLWSFFRQDSI